MFEYYGLIHVYSPGVGADNPLSTKCFHKHKSSVHLLIPSKILPINDNNDDDDNDGRRSMAILRRNISIGIPLDLSAL